MDTQLLPYRLKSARRKRRLLKEDRDKQLRRMNKEYERLCDIRAKLPYVPLDEPYQRGWKRLWVLRPEAAKSDKAYLYQDILDKLTEVQYHYDGSFKQPRRKGIWHRYYFERLPLLRGIDSHYWNANWYKFTDEQRACFKRVNYWNEKYYRWEHHYEFARPELFRIAVLPRIIDKVKLPDDELERKIAFIDDKLYKEPYRYRYWKITGGKYKNGYSRSFPEKQKYSNPLKNRSKYRWPDE